MLLNFKIHNNLIDFAIVKADVKILDTFSECLGDNVLQCINDTLEKIASSSSDPTFPRHLTGDRFADALNMGAKRYSDLHNQPDGISRWKKTLGEAILLHRPHKWTSSSTQTALEHNKTDKGGRLQPNLSFADSMCHGWPSRSTGPSANAWAWGNCGSSGYGCCRLSRYFWARKGAIDSCSGCTNKPPWILS